MPTPNPAPVHNPLPELSLEVEVKFIERVANASSLEELYALKKDLADNMRLFQQARDKGEVWALDSKEWITRDHKLREEFSCAHDEQDQRARNKKIQRVLANCLAYRFNCYAYLIREIQKREVQEGLKTDWDAVRIQVWKNEIFETADKEFNDIAALAHIPDETQRMRDRYQPKIEGHVEVGGIQFYFSAVHKTTGDHLECLFFSLKQGVLYPRLAYKSQSGGDWRIAPYLIFGHDIKYGKGALGGYTAENKPCIEIEQMLYVLESKLLPHAPVKERFMIKGLDPETDTYLKEMYHGKIPRGLERACQHKPGYCLNDSNAVAEIVNPSLIPDSFIPDFSKIPDAIMKRTTQFRGRVRLERYTFSYDGEKFVVWQSMDGEGWASPERIHREGIPITSYGTYGEALELGPLALKPFEYKWQATALEEPQHIPSSHKYYGDIRRFLAEIPFNIKYYQAKGLTPPYEKNRAKPGKRVGLIPLRTKPQNLLQLLLERSGLPPVRELAELAGMEESPDIKIKFKALLKNPGEHPTITLRGLRVAWAGISLVTIEKEIKDYLDIILDIFKGKGIPQYQHLYGALYREMMETWKKLAQGNDVESGLMRRVEIPTHLADVAEKSTGAEEKRAFKEPQSIDYQRYKRRGAIIAMLEKIQDMA